MNRMPESSQKLDAASIRVGKAGSQKNLTKDSGRALSKMTRTTAASFNQSRKGVTQSQLNNNSNNKLGQSSKSIGRRTAGSAVGKFTKPNANKS